MELGKLNRTVWRGGLSIVAALMLTGAAFAQDAGKDEGVTDPGIEVVIDDQSTVDESPVADDGTVVAIDEGEGSAGGEPDPIDYVVDDGEYIDEGVEGDGVMYTMDNEVCIECSGVVPGRPINPTEVQRNLTADAPMIATIGTSTSRPSAAAMALATPMAQCMIQHPRSAWICEWQNGAGQ